MDKEKIEKQIFSKLGLPGFIAEGLEKKVSKVVIGMKVVKHRKKVTFIRGLGKNKEELSKITKELKKKLACGGSLKESEDGKEWEIVLQGDHRKKVAEILRRDYGYSNIEIL